MGSQEVGKTLNIVLVVFTTLALWEKLVQAYESRILLERMLKGVRDLLYSNISYEHSNKNAYCLQLLYVLFFILCTLYFHHSVNYILLSFGNMGSIVER